ncbi:MAG: GIY-YIG nuclease family protein [Candidatus Sungbacteria bacterium]|uniref:GIY-YIG nuclease family protein n=1 Tax=Candidatus Sungiibacteriota bacterium TaxID=2750080 RepID=A0A931SBL9_9BACT|nr:GIY-YIG nuclease family protein [Candidatus Sungbacteria bacterium]
MHTVYVLRSLKDGNVYVGRTENLRERLEAHSKGKVDSTRERRPLKLIYFETSNNIKDAAHREIYLKTAWGKRYLKHRLKTIMHNFLSNGVLCVVMKFSSRTSARQLQQHRHV